MSQIFICISMFFFQLPLLGLCEGSDAFKVANFVIVNIIFNHRERVSELFVLKALIEALVLLAGHLQLLGEHFDVWSCLVLDLRCRELEQHDEEVTTGEAGTVLDDLAQVVCDEADDVVQLVLLVGRAHDLLEVFAAVRRKLSSLRLPSAFILLFFAVLAIGSYTTGHTRQSLTWAVWTQRFATQARRCTTHPLLRVEELL